MAGGRRGPSHVTLADVARESGFSPSTVSIVLNEAPLSRYVAIRTKEKIRATAASLGYHPDASARSLRKGRSHTVGIMLFDISDPFCTLILRGIETTFYPTPYLPIIMDAHNRRKQFEGYLEMLMERRVEGLIVVANWLFSEFQLLADIEKNDIPLVVVGRDLTANRISSVLVDNVAGGYAALRHIYELGHRKIAVIRGPDYIDSVRRWEGTQRFAAEAGLELDPRLVTQLPDAIDPLSGFGGGEALTRGLIESGVEFTAVIAFDDLTALGAMRALYTAGRRVPEDCSVIGFDDVPPAAVSSPGLTTVRQPMERMGAIAANWVLEGIQRRRGGQDAIVELELLPAEIVVRESAGALSRD